VQYQLLAVPIAVFLILVLVLESHVLLSQYSTSRLEQLGQMLK
jgi:hypothetical protein